ncbi:hypothetical protein BV96_01776 [Sphingomonas paucimobilis]|nr:hypothetical protein BV96_01776 [Sphingomonas paucimobilis]
MRDLKRRLQALEGRPEMQEDTRPLQLVYVIYQPGHPEHGKRIVAFEREPGEKNYRHVMREE